MRPAPEPHSATGSYEQNLLFHVMLAGEGLGTRGGERLAALAGLTGGELPPRNQRTTQDRQSLLKRPANRRS
jgi:hypothetical protein